LLTLWNILGHTLLGFEQSIAQPLVGVGTACATQLLLEWLRTAAQGQRPRFLDSREALIGLLLPAWIPGLAVAMLLYPNEGLVPVAFAAALSIASKGLVRVPVGPPGGGATQHLFNPSNFGITFTLAFFPWIGLAPPYHFTEHVTGLWYWGLPFIILATGIVVHALFTGRLALCLAWICGFVLQGQIRAFLFDIPPVLPLLPMTSAAFMVFTLYMIPDPATTPLSQRGQIAFGLAVAAVYGVYFSLHLAFGLFFSLFTVCLLRGLYLWWQAAWRTPEAPATPAAEEAPGG
jgi:Na+-translocating ferredoxin:NAD+ oxidoreductase RnfD subunit